MADQLIEALERTRDGYSDERSYYRFLQDAYTGGGGFRGKIRQPDFGWWGEAASRYAPFAAERDSLGAINDSEHYLERFSREDEATYRARLSIAHYPNYIGPLTDLKLSYLLRKPFVYHEQPEELAQWREDVDGRGTSWDEMRPLLALLAALWGWTPAVVDMDPAQPGESLAQAQARGAARPRVVPITPANLVDWSHDGHSFRWAKVRTDHIEQDVWNAEPVRVSRYAIWTPADVTTWEVRDEDGDRRVTGPLVNAHPFRDVPIVIFRHRACPGDAIRGMPMHAGPSVQAKRLYNLLSELDEHLRAQVFAILVLAVKGDMPAELTVGTRNALPLDPEHQQKHYYLSPDPGIAQVYEGRIEATIREIYRMARVEFTRPTSAASSGVARAYEFAQTNRAIADFASELARAEEWMDGLVWRGLGRSDDALATYQVQAPDNFDIEDLSQEIRCALDAVSLGLGPTATSRLRQRVIERLDPNMPAEIRGAIEAELEELTVQEAADRAMAREIARATSVPDEDGGEDLDA